MFNVVINVGVAEVKRWHTVQPLLLVLLIWYNNNQIPMKEGKKITLHFYFKDLYSV
jgi:hypothetical protein